MQQTLKRYFGETLTEKILDNEGDIKGDNIGFRYLLLIFRPTQQ